MLQVCCGLGTFCNASPKTDSCSSACAPDMASARAQVIVQARKPDFFSYNMSLYEVVTDDGLMRPVMRAAKGGLFCGGSARMVEAALGMEGDDILYVGDHIYTDAALAKIHFRWRTCLIVCVAPITL